MAYQGIAKVQHYVPQFLLRNFGIGKKDKLHVLDKLTGKIFITNTKNIAAESRFYDFTINEQDLTIETMLSKLEASAKPIIQSILENDSLAQLTAQDRTQLSIFLAVQMTRSKWHREQFRELPQLLEQTLRNRFGADANFSGIAEYLQTPDKNELAMHTASSVLQAGENYAPHFANKLWALAGTDAKHPFQLGDNPIGMQNMINMEPMGNIGLAVRGIEIYFPLSPRRLLALWCPSHMSMLESAARYDTYLAQALAAVTEKRVFHYRPENVMNANSIQIGYAERFVFSSNGNFSLALEMLKNNSAYQRGPRPTMS